MFPIMAFPAWYAQIMACGQFLVSLCDIVIKQATVQTATTHIMHVMPDVPETQAAVIQRDGCSPALLSGLW